MLRYYIAAAKEVEMCRCFSLHGCRTIAADVAKKEFHRSVLGVVQPGDSIPVPYGWQKAGQGSVGQRLLCAVGVLQLLSIVQAQWMLIYKCK